MKKQNLFSILHLLTPNDRVYIQIALRHFPNGCYRPTAVSDNNGDPPLPLHAIPLVDRNTALKCLEGWIGWANGDSISDSLHRLRRKLAGETRLNFAGGEYKYL